MKNEFEAPRRNIVPVEATEKSKLELDLAGLADTTIDETLNKREEFEVVDGPAFKKGEILPLIDGQKFRIEHVKNTYTVTLLDTNGIPKDQYRADEDEILKAVKDPARLEIWKPIRILPESTLVTLIDTGQVCEVLKHAPNGDLLLFNPKDPTTPIRTDIDAVATMYVPDGKGGQRLATRADRLKEEDEESERNKVVN